MLKHEIEEEGVFSVIEPKSKPYEQDFSGIDRDFAKNIKSMLKIC